MTSKYNHPADPSKPTVAAVNERDLPIVSERALDTGDVTCECGRTFTLWWNGGELDEHLCACGRFYATEHRETVLTIRQVPEDELLRRRLNCGHGGSSMGVCTRCAAVVR